MKKARRSPSATFLQVSKFHLWADRLAHLFVVDVVVFHAGTKTFGGDVLTAGGRVLAVTAYGSDLPLALAAAYKSIESVNFEGKIFRRDIAHR